MGVFCRLTDRQLIRTGTGLASTGERGTALVRCRPAGRPRAGDWVEGRSACWLCDHVLTGPGSTLTCVDPWGSKWAGDVEEARFDLNTAPLPVTKIKGTSRIVLPRLAVEGRRYHFGYDDGDHRASECLWDLVLIWHPLLPGGLIVDDYLWTDPSVPIPPGRRSTDRAYRTRSGTCPRVSGRCFCGSEQASGRR